MSTSIVFEGSKGETPCGKDVKCKIWKQGHSFKCQKMSCIRYWQPHPNIYAELYDHCHSCELATNEGLKKLREEATPTLISKT